MSSSPPSNSTTNPSIEPKSDSSQNMVKSLLHFCAQNGDEANSTLANQTIKDSQTLGLDAALKKLAENCFKDQNTGQSLSYSEMRMRYG
tara:strand:- start:2353 stop:2619 length:267 start_codon:yes stop_codon:yes gene_type:complete